MNREQILRKLHEYKRTHGEKYQIIKIGIFGSIARGDNKENSDVDILVEQRIPDLFILGNIKIDLEEELEKPVDIIRLRKGMNPFFRKRIEREAIYV